jgi:hypothetical protein
MSLEIETEHSLGESVIARDATESHWSDLYLIERYVNIVHNHSLPYAVIALTRGYFTIVLATSGP